MRSFKRLIPILLVGVVYAGANAVFAQAGMGFSSLAYRTKENEGSVSITITRTGALTNEASVEFSAAAPFGGAKNFVPVTNQVVFPAGVQSVTVPVQLIDDSTVLGLYPESSTLRLSKPSTGYSLTRSTATLSIAENDVGVSV